MVAKVEAPKSAVFSTIILSYFCIRWVSMSCRSQAEADTIKPGQVLHYSEKLLVSADGRFQLGFFNLGDPPNGYLGIWYTKDVRKTKVWVANRETPVSVGNSNLTLDANAGILKIMHGRGSPIALNLNQIIARNSIATLENSGNLVLKEVNSNGTTKRVLWESFDYPTDTLLPGMKLGWGFGTEKVWKLTSWLSHQVPASGSFSLEFEPYDDYGVLTVKRRENFYWTTRIRGNQIEDIAWDTMDTAADYNFSYVMNENCSYLTYTERNVGLLMMWHLSPRGTVLDGYDHALFHRGNQCYAYPLETGCADLPQPEQESLNQCKNNRSEASFSRLDGSFGQLSYWDENPSISFGDCWSECWYNCSCVGFGMYHANGTGCKFWSGADFQPGYGETYSHVYILPLSPLTINENYSASREGEKWFMWMTIGAVSLLSISRLGLLCYLREKRIQGDMEEKQEQSILNELTTSDRLDKTEEISNDGKKGHDLKLFSFASIMAATDNFSTENKLGQGGFGPVFKGKLPEGQEIAVKRLSVSSGQGLVEFKNELILIAKLQHMNLVRLLGCCVQGFEKMLVYEYMPNKSLDFFLFDASRRGLLDWEKRYLIIEGIAQGLLYLHKYSRLKVIHRDLKASNILLANDMTPKISDFGMARIFSRNEYEANTNRIVGTYGYMSPEYAMEGNFSVKSDVYSFGVLMLEIVTGRRNISFYNSDCCQNLVGFAWELWNDGRIMEVIDSTLADDNSTRTEIVRCIHVALLCVQDNAIDRPTMAEILPMITNQSMSLPVPKQVTIPFRCQIKDVNACKRNRESSSVTVSITDLEPR